MKRRTVILIALILLLPLVALTWAMVQIAKNEEILVRQRFSEVLEGRLQDVNSTIASFLETVEPDLDRITSIDDFDVESLRRINRTEPRLFQLFVLDESSELIYPNPTSTDSPLTRTERKFLTQAGRMFSGHDFEGVVLSSEKNSEGVLEEGKSNRISPRSDDSSSFPQSSKFKSPAPTSSKWFGWYWERGLNLIYWQRHPSGKIVGCALERSRWIADLIAQLPDTDTQTQKLDGTRHSQKFDSRIRLVNASGNSVYQWGHLQPTDSAEPFCEIPVVDPLASWRLQCFVPDDQLTASGNGSWLGLAAMLATIALVLGLCGYFLVREYARDMRSAEQQVSFVNQVSHELKTPLTNIRMYAELLERDFDHLEIDVETVSRKRLDVILSESQRLSRLIGNVLTFARHRRDTLTLRPTQAVPAQVIEQIVDRFRPSLEEKGITIDVTSTGQEAMSLDTDILEQIVGNLISNVEKYAASGRQLGIDSCAADGELTINVRDAGPGIKASNRELVFEPFRRECNDVSSATGTGIGLSIAQELTRLHGGDLVLKESQQGCWFQATLKSRES